MKKAKDPAFLFYPGDFNTGTQFFTDEQVGKYMRLLMAQHQHGHLREDQVLFICKSYDKDIMSKFVKDSNGLWYNERLEIEVQKRKNFTESRKNNREGKTKSKNISSSYVPHMENENENINKDELKKGVQGETDVLSDESLSMIFDEGTMERYQMTFRQIDVKDQLEKFVLKIRGSPLDYKHRGTGGIRNAFQYQLEHAKPVKINGSKTHQSNTSGPKNPTAKTFGTL